MDKDFIGTNFNELSSFCYRQARCKGFWDGNRELGTSLMLISSELSEILEADRKGQLNSPSSKIPKCSNFEEELMDVIIRCLDLAGRNDLDLDRAFTHKMAVNAMRKHKHGKNY